MIKLNGKEEEGFEDSYILELLENKGYKTNRIAVEYNGEILRKDKYADTKIKDNDVIEVVSFVGGG